MVVLSLSHPVGHSGLEMERGFSLFLIIPIKLLPLLENPQL